VAGPRAVLDTSVLVSAILRPDGPSGAILRAARRGRFVMVTSPAILDELVDVLTRPKLRGQARLTFEDVAKIRLALQQFAETVPGAYRDVEAVATDPKDNPVVATALEGEADHLVTLDERDLLSLKVILGRAHRPVQIVSPPDFLKGLASRPPARRPRRRL
jgi:putative PIN family toxin of toxin-antitoxin system